MENVAVIAVSSVPHAQSRRPSSTEASSPAKTSNARSETASDTLAARFVLMSGSTMPATLSRGQGRALKAAWSGGALGAAWSGGALEAAWSGGALKAAWSGGARSERQKQTPR